MEKIVEGIDYTQLAKVTLHRVTDRPGVASDIFGALGQQGLNIELIATNSLGRGHADISFAVLESNLEGVCRVLENLKRKFKTKDIIIDRECAMITVYGARLATTPGIAGRIFGKLSERKINIEMINTSMSALNIVVKKDRVMDAVGAIRTEFSI
jgi:aspartate kinase